METRFIDKSGKEIGKVKLHEEIFNQDVNKVLLWETVNTLLRNKRRGSAKTKNRSEVSGGGRKPWRQKGIGWARHGSIRSPIWRGGGVAHGPKPRDYFVTLPKKKKLKALFASLTVKAKEEKIFVIEDLNLEVPKTRNFVDTLHKINLKDTRTLVVVEKMDENIKLATRNIPYVNLKQADDINCYDVLDVDYLLITKKGLEKLEQRCVTKKS